MAQMASFAGGGMKSVKSFVLPIGQRVMQRGDSVASSEWDKSGLWQPPVPLAAPPRPRVGDPVDAYWESEDTWYRATIERDNPDGTYDVLWEGGTERTEQMPREYVRALPAQRFSLPTPSIERRCSKALSDPPPLQLVSPPPVPLPVLSLHPATPATTFRGAGFEQESVPADRSGERERSEAGTNPTAAAGQAAADEMREETGERLSALAEKTAAEARQKREADQLTEAEQAREAEQAAEAERLRAARKHEGEAERHAARGGALAEGAATEIARLAAPRPTVITEKALGKDGKVWSVLPAAVPASCVPSVAIHRAFTYPLPSASSAAGPPPRAGAEAAPLAGAEAAPQAGAAAPQPSPQRRPRAAHADSAVQCQIPAPAQVGRQPSGGALSSPAPVRGASPAAPPERAAPTSPHSQTGGDGPLSSPTSTAANRQLAELRSKAEGGDAAAAARLWWVRRLVGFYARHSPQKQAIVLDVLQQYEPGTERRSLTELCLLYGVDPAKELPRADSRVAALRGTAACAADWRRCCFAFWEQHDPAQGAHAAATVGAWRGREQQLFAELERLYQIPYCGLSSPPRSPRRAASPPPPVSACGADPWEIRLLTLYAIHGTGTQQDARKLVALARAEGQQSRMWRTAVAQSGGVAPDPVHSLRDRVALWYAVRAPHKIQHVPALLQYYRGREAELHRSLHIKYGELPQWSFAEDVEDAHVELGAGDAPGGAPEEEEGDGDAGRSPPCAPPPGSAVSDAAQRAGPAPDDAAAGREWEAELAAAKAATTKAEEEAAAERQKHCDQQKTAEEAEARLRLQLATAEAAMQEASGRAEETAGALAAAQDSLAAARRHESNLEAELANCRERLAAATAPDPASHKLLRHRNTAHYLLGSTERFLRLSAYHTLLRYRLRRQVQREAAAAAARERQGAERRIAETAAEAERTQAELRRRLEAAAVEAQRREAELTGRIDAASGAQSERQAAEARLAEAAAEAQRAAAELRGRLEATTESAARDRDDLSARLAAAAEAAALARAEADSGRKAAAADAECKLRQHQGRVAAALLSSGRRGRLELGWQALARHRQQRVAERARWAEAEARRKEQQRARQCVAAGVLLAGTARGRLRAAWAAFVRLRQRRWVERREAAACAAAAAKAQRAAAGALLGGTVRGRQAVAWRSLLGWRHHRIAQRDAAAAVHRARLEERRAAQRQAAGALLQAATLGAQRAAWHSLRWAIRTRQARRSADAASDMDRRTRVGSGARAHEEKLLRGYFRKLGSACWAARQRRAEEVVQQAAARQRRMQQSAVDALRGDAERLALRAAWQRLWGMLLRRRAARERRRVQATACGALLRGGQAAQMRSAWHCLSWSRQRAQLRRAEENVTRAAAEAEAASTKAEAAAQLTARTRGSAAEALLAGAERGRMRAAWDRLARHAQRTAAKRARQRAAADGLLGGSVRGVRVVFFNALRRFAAQRQRERAAAEQSAAAERRAAEEEQKAAAQRDARCRRAAGSAESHDRRLLRRYFEKLAGSHSARRALGRRAAAASNINDERLLRTYLHKLGWAMHARSRQRLLERCTEAARGRQDRLLMRDRYRQLSRAAALSKQARAARLAAVLVEEQVNGRTACCEAEALERGRLIARRMVQIGSNGLIGLELDYNAERQVLHVARVQADGPGQRAGLSSGDRLLWIACGREQAALERRQWTAVRDPRALREALSARNGAQAGSKVRVCYLKQDEDAPRETTLILGTRSTAEAAAELRAMLRRCLRMGQSGVFRVEQGPGLPMPLEAVQRPDSVIEPAVGAITDPMQLWQRCQEHGMPVCSSVTQQEWIGGMLAVLRSLSCPGLLLRSEIQRAYFTCGGGRDPVPFVDLFDVARELLKQGFMDADAQAAATRAVRRSLDQRRSMEQSAAGGLNMSTLSMSLSSFMGMSPPASPASSPGSPRTSRFV
eukprot:TRINITY_DN13517_c0_g3_i1.p1 TRINITY_DN13517_c0_g3~~TRINITY_DN13517_c0_g3_i1.p1  ORF type:complete len:1938 (+),score=425.58 TRINITY_DN13517_c0_g3_i1:79-5892(+)